ncbi:NAD(P)H-dependent glycerol-3-phosphate dehydrogenase [uncultured Tateyamaria sp.]|uniref:NAD(P)H-dependent glycerol-3-phosphate dehydrogenase n=1 Tax=uncultured Tateyamaria sp. TaxID=455651 RepID=UPI0026073C1B|nr:NAD(P)H-dependent glycerol-3-phosphate dehydrogenase [uncultured Tateyamaria sp.]
MSVGIVGAGAFGTALAITLGQEHSVVLWARDAEHVAEMQADRSNRRRLPGANFPANLTVIAKLETVFACDIILFAVPMQSLGAFVAGHDLSAMTAVACCKGIDLTTGTGPTHALSGADCAAVLTGPSFAADIAAGLPTALTLACRDEIRAETLQARLSTSTLRLYRTTDVVGAELGGALKNIIAIGCGAVMGAGLGDSARAALLTRGFAEMQRVGAALGAQPETLMGLSGLGDLTLTCTSDKSRNYRLGLALGAGTEFDAGTTVEGAATARALRGVAAKHDLDLPVCATIADLVDGTIDIQGAMARLLARPLKEE